MSEPTWGTSFNAATPAQVATYFRPPHISGADHLAYILAMGPKAAAIYARGRARGWWDANDGEKFSAYSRLATLIDEGASFPDP